MDTLQKIYLFIDIITTIACVWVVVTALLYGVRIQIGTFSNIRFRGLLYKSKYEIKNRK